MYQENGAKMLIFACFSQHLTNYCSSSPGSLKGTHCYSKRSYQVNLDSPSSPFQWRPAGWRVVRLHSLLHRADSNNVGTSGDQSKYFDSIDSSNQFTQTSDSLNRLF